MRKVSPQEQESDRRFNVEVFWRVFWRRKHFIIIPILVAVFVSAIGVRFLTPMYGSSTVIRVEDRNLLSQDVARIVQVEERRRHMHDSEILLRMKSDVLSSAFLDRLIQYLGLNANEEIRRKIMESQPRSSAGIPIEDLIKRELRKHLEKNISFDIVGPGLFEISYYDYSPDGCYVVAQALASLFIEMQQVERIKAFQEATEFSDEQLAVYKEHLENSEKELEKVQKSLADKKLGKIPITEGNIKLAETLEKQIAINIKDRNDVVQRIKQNLGSYLGTVPSSKAMSTDAELLDLENSLISHRETELLLELGIVGRASPELLQSQDVISEIHTSIQRRFSDMVNKSYSKINADYRSLVVEYFFQLSYLKGYRAKLDKLRYYIDAYYENLKLIPQMERRISQLRETVESNRSLYNAFLGAKTSAQISEAVQSTNLGKIAEIVEHAVKPVFPVKPNKLKILLISVLFSGIIGFGGLMLAELSDTSFNTIEEVEAMLGLRVLGTIPRFESEEKWMRGNPKKRMAIWLTASLLATGIALLGFYYYGKSTHTQIYVEDDSRAVTSQGSTNGGSD